jgi:cell division protein FtsL
MPEYPSENPENFQLIEKKALSKRWRNLIENEKTVSNSHRK